MSEYIVYIRTDAKNKDVNKRLEEFFMRQTRLGGELHDMEGVIVATCSKMSIETGFGYVGEWTEEANQKMGDLSAEVL